MRHFGAELTSVAYVYEAGAVLVINVFDFVVAFFLIFVIIVVL